MSCVLEKSIAISHAGASRRCDGCGTGMRAADASFGHHGELLCDGCASEQSAPLSSFDSPIEERGGSDGWATLRFVLIGSKLMLVLAYLLMR